MASFHVIAAELGKIFVLYRQPEPGNTEFEALVRIWADVLPDVRDAELTAALRRVCARSRFFPLPADVTRQVEELRQQPTRTTLAELP
ncbi:MAG: inverted formin-2, partial [Bilophila sp.]